MEKYELKYNAYFIKVKAVIESCKTKHQLIGALSMVERMIDLYPSIKNDELKDFLFERMEKEDRGEI